MKITLLITTFLIYLTAVAQSVRQPLSAGYIALSAYSKDFVNIFSGTTNPAALTNIKSGAFAVFSEKRFLLNDLSGYTAISAVPTKSGTVGVQADYFGFSDYNQSQLGMIYARKVTANIDIGIKFNYHMVRMKGYNTLSAVNFEAGAVFHLSDAVYTGIRIYNPESSRLGKTGSEKLASVYSSGLGYEASEKLFIGAEIVKSEDLPLGVNVGLQYRPHPKVYIGAGICSGNNSSYISAGLDVGFGRLDVNTAYHSQLGFTPGILLIVNFKKPTDE